MVGCRRRFKKGGKLESRLSPLKCLVSCKSHSDTDPWNGDWQPIPVGEKMWLLDSGTFDDDSYTLLQSATSSLSSKDESPTSSLSSKDESATSSSSSSKDDSCNSVHSNGTKTTSTASVSTLSTGQAVPVTKPQDNDSNPEQEETTAGNVKSPKQEQDSNSVSSTKEEQDAQAVNSPKQKQVQFPQQGNDFTGESVFEDEGVSKTCLPFFTNRRQKRASLVATSPPTQNIFGRKNIKEGSSDSSLSDTPSPLLEQELQERLSLFHLKYHANRNGKNDEEETQSTKKETGVSKPSLKAKALRLIKNNSKPEGFSSVDPHGFAASPDISTLEEEEEHTHKLEVSTSFSFDKLVKYKSNTQSQPNADDESEKTLRLRNKISELLGDFGQDIQHKEEDDDICLNDGICYFGYEKFVVVVEVPSNSDCVFIYSMLHRLRSVDNAISLMYKALCLNYSRDTTKGACISMDDNEFTLSYVTPVDAVVGFTVLRNILGNFVELVVDLESQLMEANGTIFTVDKLYNGDTRIRKSGQKRTGLSVQTDVDEEEIEAENDDSEDNNTSLFYL